MSKYEVHTIETAPEASRPLFRNLHDALGMIPNLAAAMAESPELLKGFLTLRSIFYGGSFTAAEVQVLALTNAFENGCSYCMALHTSLAVKAGLPQEAIGALRAGRPPQDTRLGALSEFSRTLVKHRGHVSGDDLERFTAAGYTKRQALEAVLGVAVSILPNFAHHLTHSPLDDAFGEHAWMPHAEAQAAHV